MVFSSSVPSSTDGVGTSCTFTTGFGCSFNIGSHCTFNTGNGCTFLVYGINSCTFKYKDFTWLDVMDNGIILDKEDNKHYVLNKEFVRLQRLTNG